MLLGLDLIYTYLTTHDPNLGSQGCLALISPYLNMARQIPIEYVAEAL
jgi:hypothetical protein